MSKVAAEGTTILGTPYMQQAIHDTMASFDKFRPKIPTWISALVTLYNFVLVLENLIQFSKSEYFIIFSESYARITNTGVKTKASIFGQKLTKLTIVCKGGVLVYRRTTEGSCYGTDYNDNAARLRCLTAVTNAPCCHNAHAPTKARLVKALHYGQFKEPLT